MKDAAQWDVFICYAREDVTLARRLYDDLTQAGVAPWLDRKKLLPGQNWKRAIKQAMQASVYIMTLLSTHSVSKQGYVQKELKAALELLEHIPPSAIFIIPVRLDACEPLDERLQDLHWVDLFESYDEGLAQILQVVRLPGAVIPKAAAVWERGRQQRRRELEADYDLFSEKIIRLRKAWVLETDPAKKLQWEQQTKDAERERAVIEAELRTLLAQAPGESTLQPSEQPPPTPAPPVQQAQPAQKPIARKQAGPPTANVIRLRSEPLTVSEETFRDVFKLDQQQRPLEYIQNDYDDQGEVVLDRVTGLTWQKSGSDKWLTYTDAKKYIEDLNRQKFASYADWRLPTIPELMSLLEPEKQSNKLYINPIFDATQTWCWSANLRIKGEGSSGAAWGVYFHLGFVYWHDRLSNYYVRAVRS